MSLCRYVAIVNYALCFRLSPTLLKLGTLLDVCWLQNSEVTSHDIKWSLIERTCIENCLVQAHLPPPKRLNHCLFRTILQSTILYCEAKKDENIVRYNRALDDLIGTVRRELVVIRNKVCSPALLDADSIPQVATEKLKLMKEDLANLSTKARNYATYQERFGSSMSSSLQKKALSE